ncbi:MAG: DNA polymerase III subunit gamma/tau [Ignavibacteria bacterium]|nr:DNA polymerase III subunit gamma/tau [Ignavibacteria bacterium]OIO20211.1 MAG: DNA polymerase III, subunit gamma and tau [Ignavibacteria bacterium CG1_02_37_35]PIX92952.1 MAG: DNA polymerase III subunit gamma/tau [Ignavibacteria bacterium CG_4_10_14_3_um_filter_37_18]
MSFVVTARKYRPQLFDEVVGQEHITNTLKNGIKSGRVAHAFIFTGPRGVGKTTTARILAKALNCENPRDAEPCNECELCKSIQSNQSMDIIEIDAASNRGIDDIRTLRDSVKYTPTKGKYKVYIIDEVHMLTKESFNALLKTLEEPPSHTIFIFATTDIHRVPITIISRCQRYDFRRIDIHTIKSLLNKIADDQKILIDDRTLTLIAKKSDGGLRDAESFFDQVVAFCGAKVEYETVIKILNFIDDELYFQVSDAIKSKDYQTAFTVAEKIYQNGWSFTDFLEGLIEHFRNILTVQISGTTSLIETAEIYKALYKSNRNIFTENDLVRIISFLTKTSLEIRYAVNYKLKIEMALCVLIGLESTLTISQLVGMVNSGKFSELQISIPDEHLKDKTIAIEKPSKQEAEKRGVSKIAETATVLIPSTSDPAIKKTFDKCTTGIQDRLFNYESVVKQWEGFVSSISNEKKLLFGKIMSQLSPVSLNEMTLNVHLADGFSREVLIQHEDYFTQKANEIFGAKLKFNFIEIEENEVKTEEELPKSAKRMEVPDTKLYNYIKNELGGKEVY